MNHNTRLMAAEGDNFAPVSFFFFVIDAPVSSSSEVELRHLQTHQIIQENRHLTVLTFFSSSSK